MLIVEDAILKDVAAEEPCKSYYLNVFNLGSEVTDDEILKYYAKAGIKGVHRVSREAVDIEFSSKDDLIKAIDLDTSTFNGRPFFIRTSYHNQRNAGGFRGGRGRGRGDRYHDRDSRRR